jgi:flavodoxin
MQISKTVRRWLIGALCLLLILSAAAVPVSAKSNSKRSKTKTLVIYFSATGNTRRAAKQIAKGANADLYEITPVEKYTSADLDYSNDNSRVVKEHNDANSRPAYKGDVDNWDQYTRILIGYPLWWQEAPHIVDNFVESHDFTGKTVIPFCTSMSSGLGDSGTQLARRAKTGKWLKGKRFSEHASKARLRRWGRAQVRR